MKILTWSVRTEKSKRMQQCIKILLFVTLNEAQHVSGDTPPIIRSLKLYKQPLVLHRWKVVGRADVGRCQVAYADNVFGSWRWAVCRPKHVELNLKWGIIKLWYTVASCSVFHCRNCTMMHGSTNIKFTNKFSYYLTKCNSSEGNAVYLGDWYVCTVYSKITGNNNNNSNKNQSSYKENILDILCEYTFHYQLMHLLIKNTFTVHI